jgi:hypothetical protein
MTPDLFGEFSPVLLAFLQQKTSLKEVTWAIGTISGVEPGLIKHAFKTLRSFIREQDPSLRGYAAWALGNLGYAEVTEELKTLLSDDEAFTIQECRAEGNDGCRTGKRSDRKARQTQTNMIIWFDNGQRKSPCIHFKSSLDAEAIIQHEYK